MDCRTFNKSGSPTVLFVKGFGNRFDDASVDWIIDRLTEAGYRIHGPQLPTGITDFEREYCRPVQREHDEQELAGVVSHSLGGLVTAFLETTAQMVYLSPWWGIYQGKVSPLGAVDYSSTPDSGSHPSDQYTARRAREVPLRRRVGAASEANLASLHHGDLPCPTGTPPISADAVVFVSLADTIISLEAIGTAVRSGQIRLYDGGHQLFAATDRQEAIEEVLAELPE